MLAQTKRAYDALTSAGLKRGDFSVRTPTDRKTREYQKTQITLYKHITPEQAQVIADHGYRLQYYRSAQVALSNPIVMVASFGMPEGVFVRDLRDTDDAYTGRITVDQLNQIANLS